MLGSQGKEKDKETQTTVTQFTAGDLLQHEREKVVQAESVSKPTVCLLHISTFVLEPCQCDCARGWWGRRGGGSGVQLTTMRRASDVFDRGCVAAHEGYLGLQRMYRPVPLLPRTKFAITHKTRVWFH